MCDECSGSCLHKSSRSNTVLFAYVVFMAICIYVTSLREDLELLLTALMLRSLKLLLGYRTVFITDGDLRWAEKI
jgi:hypothetical protein